MRFGPVPVADAVGCLAAHSLRIGSASLRKGQRISAADVAALLVSGVEKVVAVSLDPDDVGEDQAARHLAERLSGAGVRVEPPFTGRCNLYAAEAGVLLIERGVVDRVNGVDEALTAATLPAFKPVVAGEMIATVKIIPYAVPEALLARGIGAITTPAISVRPYRLRRVGAISTLSPGLKQSVIDKTVAVLRRRLEPASAAIVSDLQVAHEPVGLRAAFERSLADGAELVVVFGASAIADRRDVIPSAIEIAGGTIEHFGMPVDPGNLLLIGRIGTVPVIGAPGCARSPKENGFDWILHRLLAEVAVTRADITGLGVGGLLMEIVQRGQPRSGGDPDPEPDTEA